MPESSRSLFRRVRARLAALLLLPVLVGGLAACSSGNDDEEKEAPQQERPVAASWQVDVADLAGELTDAKKRKMQEQIVATLTVYVDQALVAVPADDPFGSFTKNLAKRAKADRDLLTSAGLGEVESVVPTELTANLSVMARKGVPAGATAIVRIGLDVDDTPVTLSGQLLLTPVGDQWKIFGYDLHREGTD
ncbi:MAG: hypothetical protein HZY75_12365 [Nocardioidaceae bacterium]|nr:MAG: hypothetical protein HZY75_12365 [Nocardioidaceae bacterium]